jgi:hypothetical protein
VASATPTITARQSDPKITSESTVVFAKNGHQYEVIDVSMTWEKAREECEKRGGYLATITSVEEQIFILDFLLKQVKKDFYWLGGYREGKDWKWVTGEDFNFKNWLPAQPDGQNGANKIDIARIRPSWSNKGKPGQWDDVPNSLKIGYICEWDSD